MIASSCATSKGDYGLERYILAQDRWQIELLANLDAVPEAGALVVASWPKPLPGQATRRACLPFIELGKFGCQ